MPPDSPHDLIRQTYAAVGHPAQWQGLLGAWARALEADSALLFTPGGHFNALPMVGHDYDTETAREYGDYYHQHDVWTLNAKQNRLFVPGRADCGEKLVSQVALRQSLFYNDFLRRMGQEWLLCTVLCGEENALGMPETVLSFYRERKRRAFGRGAVNALQAGITHLQRSLTLHHELVQSRAERALLQSGVDQLDVGLVQLNSDGRIHWANPRAQALLRPLTPQAAPADVPLPALQKLDRQARAGRFTGQRLLTAHGVIYAMATPHHAAVTGESRAPQLGPLIWLIDPHRNKKTPVIWAADLFALTAAEQKVLTLLLEDRAPKQIAQQLGLGLSTVRSQLSSLLHKTGVRRQQDLVRLMAAFPPV